MGCTGLRMHNTKSLYIGRGIGAFKSVIISLDFFNSSCNGVASRRTRPAPGGWLLLFRNNRKWGRDEIRVGDRRTSFSSKWRSWGFVGALSQEYYGRSLYGWCSFVFKNPRVLMRSKASTRAVALSVTVQGTVTRHVITWPAGCTARSSLLTRSSDFSDS